MLQFPTSATQKVEKFGIYGNDLKFLIEKC